MRRVLPLGVAVVVGFGLLTQTSSSSGGAAAAPTHGRIVALNANQSTNWSGYNQGALEQGLTLFNQVAADWTVPTATQHTAKQAESSSTWIGIGGGCITADCLVTDPTLIQAGTEQDVDAAGHATYFAWFELVPLPGLQVNMTVRPGDTIHVDIREVIPASEIWSIKINDKTNGQSFGITVPYPSTKGSAEWIVETPLTVGTGGAGLSTMPNLSTVHFDNATRNGANARLKSSEELQLVNGSQIVATPSAPDSDTDGFNACTYATSCAIPAS